MYISSSKLVSKVLDVIEKKSHEKYYIYKLALLLVLTSCFFSNPQILLFFFENKLPSAWETILLKSKDLTNNLSHIDPNTWQAKKVFRLTIPIIIKLFHLPPYAIIILQIIIGYLTYVFTYKLAIRIFKDSVHATLFTSTFAFLYCGRASFFEYYYTWFDGFSFFFLLMTMYYRKIYGIFIFSMLAAWNDERAFIALSLVLLFHFFENKDSAKIVYEELFSINKKVTTILISMILYLITRLILTNHFGMHTPSDGANYTVFTDRTYNYIPIGLTTFFEGFTILIILFFYFIIKNKDYLRALLTSLPLLIIIAVSYFVTDVTRSGAFAFPIAFITSKYMIEKINKQVMTQILMICLVITFLIPPIFICADWGINLMLPKHFLIFLYEHLRDFVKNNYL